MRRDGDAGALRLDGQLQRRRKGPLCSTAPRPAIISIYLNPVYALPICSRTTRLGRPFRRLPRLPEARPFGRVTLWTVAPGPTWRGSHTIRGPGIIPVHRLLQPNISVTALSARSRIVVNPRAGFAQMISGAGTAGSGFARPPDVPTVRCRDVVRLRMPS